jgi:hypothetical protein
MRSKTALLLYTNKTEKANDFAAFSNFFSKNLARI